MEDGFLRRSCSSFASHSTSQESPHEADNRSLWRPRFDFRFINGCVSLELKAERDLGASHRDAFPVIYSRKKVIPEPAIIFAGLHAAFLESCGLIRTGKGRSARAFQ
jgi:hypothetical protein